ncbi:MAG: ATP-dependent DNA helicase RecG [Acidobacteria bacterium]|nr:ATP-dependent DNA helicase RecG [Acidobacteriota bacterium]
MTAPDDFFRTPLRHLKGVGQRRGDDLERVGLRTVDDLVSRFPFRYEDRGRFQPIASVQVGQTVSVSGELINCRVALTRRPNFKLFEALVRDDSGALRVVWPNQPYLDRALRPRQRVVLYGQVDVWRDRVQLTSPQHEILDDDEAETIHTGRIVPVYERAGAMSLKLQRRLIFDVLQRLPPAVEDPLPAELRSTLDLPDRRTALLESHFPPAGTPLDLLNGFRTRAQRRLIFEEFFLFQLGLGERRRLARAEVKPFRVAVDDRVRRAARAVLPFRLTAGQRGALKEIVDDMQRPTQMNRLLQGDVGSGKTIVALLAALVAMENGLQAALMVPTEILAEQHYEGIQQRLAATRFRTALLLGATPAAERRATLDAVARGAVHLLVGTHALMQERVAFQQLGLAIIDEQHRFGVAQRAALRAKGLRPDMLVMTATPIPRTLALTVYGDLDVSVIRDRPAGRQPITTIVEPDTRRDRVYDLVRDELGRGRQAYVVYPLVEESEKVDLKAATEMADHLAQEIFPEFRVGLVHGRMAPEARDGAMRRFARGDVDLLVATTVVEVGIDVPNASMMVIEHAERFGLSQLHQLRGRVGRDRHPSSCVLLYQEPVSDEARVRLAAMAATTDGFVIAERDLTLRGPGDLTGTRQSGMPTLRVGNLRRDQALMDLAWREARDWSERDDPDAAALQSLARQTWSARFGLLEVG